MSLSAYFLYFTTVLIWGSTWLAIKFQLGEVDILVSVIYRFGLAAAVLFGWCLISGSRLRVPLSEHRFLALQGLCLFGVNYWLVYWSSLYLTSGVVAVIFSSILFLNIFNGRIFLQRQFAATVFLGGVVGMAGMVLLFYPEVGQLSLDDEAVLGFLIGFAATYAASVGNILATRNTVTGLPVRSVNAWGMLYGTVLMSLLALVTGAEFRFGSGIDYAASLLYLSLFGSVLAFGAYLRLMAMVGPERAAYSSLLYPVVALLLSTVFESYVWTLPALIGLALIVIGNVLVLRH